MGRSAREHVQMRMCMYMYMNMYTWVPKDECRRVHVCIGVQRPCETAWEAVGERGEEMGEVDATRLSVCGGWGWPAR